MVVNASSDLAVTLAVSALLADAGVDTAVESSMWVEQLECLYLVSTAEVEGTTLNPTCYTINVKGCGSIIYGVGGTSMA